MKMKTLFVLWIFFLVFPVIAQNNKLTWYAFNMSFGVSSYSDKIVKSIVGQTLVGSSTNSNTRIESGFLVALVKGPAVAVNEKQQIPLVFSLQQNYPNPFNQTTKICFDVTHRAHIHLKIYDILGRQIATLVDDIKEAGSYSLNWDGVNDGGDPVSSGVYFYILIAENFIQVRKMILVK
jgi:flagellar hook assembly protein FlgD